MGACEGFDPAAEAAIAHRWSTGRVLDPHAATPHAQVAHDQLDVQSVLRPGETIRKTVSTTDSLVALTNRRLLVVTGKRLALDLPIPGVRRIQLDVERRRPSTLVIVPDDPGHEAQVLTLEDEHLDATTEIVAVIGMLMGDHERGHDRESA
jgi:hypothetical protein